MKLITSINIDIKKSVNNNKYYNNLVAGIIQEGGKK